MPAIPYTYRRSATYYFRRKIPQELQAHYGKAEVNYSLKTKDQKEAGRKARIEAAKWDQEWEKLRRYLQLETVSELTQEDINKIADYYLADIVSKDESIRASGNLLLDDGRIIPLLKEWIEHHREKLKRAYAVGDSNFLRPAAERRLQSLGLNLTPDSPSWQPLLYAILQADMEANKVMAERFSGELIKSPQADLSSVSALQSRETVSRLFERYAKERQLPEKTLNESRLTLERFIKASGDVRLSELTKKHGVGFKDAMVAQGLSAGTIRKHLGLLNAVLNWGVANDHLSFNPVATVKVAASRQAENPGYPFTAEQLNCLFRTPVFTKGERHANGGKEACYWLPLLALYTGARLTELGQLLVSDVVPHGERFYLDITDRAEHANVKNLSSKRRVPVHHELEHLGFLVYVATLKANGEKFLFPHFRGDSQRISKFSSWFSSYRQQHGITGTGIKFHSFRHGFKDACRESGIPKDVHDALTGHSDKSEGDKYGSGVFPLNRLFQEIDKLQYHGLDLRHLSPANAGKRAANPQMAAVT